MKVQLESGELTVVFARSCHGLQHTTEYSVSKTEGCGFERFHHLRHACASLLLAQGVSPRAVTEVLGRSQV